MGSTLRLSATVAVLCGFLVAAASGLATGALVGTVLSPTSPVLLFALLVIGMASWYAVYL